MGYPPELRRFLRSSVDGENRRRTFAATWSVLRGQKLDGKMPTTLRRTKCARLCRTTQACESSLLPRPTSALTRERATKERHGAGIVRKGNRRSLAYYAGYLLILLTTRQIRRVKTTLGYHTLLQPCLETWAFAMKDELCVPLLVLT